MILNIFDYLKVLIGRIFLKKFIVIIMLLHTYFVISSTLIFKAKLIANTNGLCHHSIFSFYFKNFT